MSLTITLVTPPDIFENESPSILLMNLTESQQDEATKWLAECPRDLEINIYFFQGEPNTVWFFHALSRSEYKYINLDNAQGISHVIQGYVLGKPSTYYTTENGNTQAIVSHINSNRVDSVQEFFKRVLSES